MKTIKLSVIEPAAAAGITNASELHRASKLPMSTCYDLWAEKSEKVALDTLAKLCTAFKCGVETILVLKGR